jgi:4-hydroxybenzoate polyprenyltransferase
METTTNDTAPGATRGGPADYLRALRPRQWVKNGLLFVGTLFTVDQPHPLEDWLRLLGAFVLFCALSSAIYLINDVCDLERDRKHPRKRDRPIASGRVPVPTAVAMALVLGIGGLLASPVFGYKFIAMAYFYAALTLSYSFWLKREVILDVMALAGCYVVRAAAGAVAISANITAWLIVCTSFGALLIGLGKRRTELASLEDTDGRRRADQGYTLPLLDQMMAIAAAGTLVAYILYTFFSTTGIHDRRWLMITDPFVVYGVFRYLYIVVRRGVGSDPSSELLRDTHLVVCALLWILVGASVLILSG